MTMPDPDKDEAIGKLAQLAERMQDMLLDEAYDRVRQAGMDVIRRAA